MKKGSFLCAPFILLMLCLSFGAHADPAAAESLADFKSLVTSKCAKCHGQKKVKGGIDFVKMLDKGLHADDINHWAKVVEMVQSDSMPPDDDDNYPLPAKDAKIIVGTIYRALGDADQSKTTRMITPDEYKNAIADIFQLDLKNYDPIGDLYAFTSKPDHTFYTVESKRLINRFYFNALESGTSRVIKEYNADNQPEVSKKFRKKPAPKKPSSKKPTPKKPPKPKAPKKPKAPPKVLTAEEKKKAAEKAHLKMMNAVAARNKNSSNETGDVTYPMHMSLNVRDSVDGFIEYAGDYWGIRGKSWKGNSNIPIDLLGGAKQQFRALPRGRYRIRIRASAHDRDAISRLPAEQGRHNVWAKDNVWGNGYRLETEKCKLTLYKTATRTRTTSDPATRYTAITSFYVEDTAIKEYSFDLSSHWNMSLGILFNNGAVNVVNTAGTVATMRFDEQGNPTFVPAETTLPTIRIYDISVDRLGDVEMGSLFVKDMPAFDDAKARQKITTFVSELALAESPRYGQFYETLRTSLKMTAHQAFAETVKWILVSSDFLYIHSGSENAPGRLRHASFSLLKTTPMPEFSAYYSRYRSKEIGAKEFTRKLVQDPGFSRFVRSFSDQWLHLSEITPNAPDRAKYPDYYDDELEEHFRSESYAYIHHLFAANRSVSELVKSDYAFMNDKLARFYGLDEVADFSVAKVAIKDTKRMGILSNASFMVANSNGVEDLPFRRAKWISENILDRKIPPPPDVIDVSKFGKAEGGFAAKIKAHIGSEQCYTCHRMLDGIATNIHMFDNMGSLKTDEFNAKEAAETLALLREELDPKTRRIASAFTKSLLSFSTGKKLTINDLMAVEEILDEVEADGFRSRDILEQIVTRYF